jgi:enoyl-CoA hydratase
VFADTHARVGILPGGGMSARLPQVVGLAMARRLSMTGEVVDPALAAEEKIAFAQHRDFEGLGDQFREVSKRNKRQIES